LNQTVDSDMDSI